MLAHVDGCSACGEKLGDLRVTAGLVREGVEVESATGPVLSTERRASLLTRVASSPRRRFGLSPAARKTLRTLLRPRALGVAAGFAVVVVGLAGLFWPEIAREGGGAALQFWAADRLGYEAPPAAVVASRGLSTAGKDQAAKHAERFSEYEAKAKMRAEALLTYPPDARDSLAQPVVGTIIAQPRLDGSSPASVPTEQRISNHFEYSMVQADGLGELEKSDLSAGLSGKAGGEATAGAKNGEPYDFPGMVDAWLASKAPDSTWGSDGDALGELGREGGRADGGQIWRYGMISEGRSRGGAGAAGSAGGGGGQAGDDRAGGPAGSRGRPAGSPGVAGGGAGVKRDVAGKGPTAAAGMGGSAAGDANRAPASSMAPEAARPQTETAKPPATAKKSGPERELSVMLGYANAETMRKLGARTKDGSVGESGPDPDAQALFGTRFWEDPTREADRTGGRRDDAKAPARRGKTTEVANGRGVTRDGGGAGATAAAETGGSAAAPEVWTYGMLSGDVPQKPDGATSPGERPSVPRSAPAASPPPSPAKPRDDVSLLGGLFRSGIRNDAEGDGKRTKALRDRLASLETQLDGFRRQGDSETPGKKKSSRRSGEVVAMGGRLGDPVQDSLADARRDARDLNADGHADWVFGRPLPDGSPDGDVRKTEPAGRTMGRSRLRGEEERDAGVPVLSEIPALKRPFDSKAEQSGRRADRKRGDIPILGGLPGKGSLFREEKRAPTAGVATESSGPGPVADSSLGEVSGIATTGQNAGNYSAPARPGAGPAKSSPAPRPDGGSAAHDTPEVAGPWNEASFGMAGVQSAKVSRDETAKPEGDQMSLLQKVARLKAVRVQKAKAHHAAIGSKIGRNLESDSPDYQAARRDALRAESILENARPSFRPEQYDSYVRQNEELKLRIERGEQASESRQEGQGRARIEAEIAERIHETKRRRETQKRELIKQALELKQERKFAEAIEPLDEVLAIDPKDDRASFLKELLEDMVQFKRQQASRVDREKERLKTLTDADESMTPWTQEIRFPADWVERQERRAGIVGEADEEVSRRTVTRVFNVRDLAKKLEIAERDSKERAGGEGSEGVRKKGIDTGTLADVVRAGIGAKSRDEGAGRIGVEEFNGRLVVSASPRQMARIDELLGALRDDKEDAVPVEVRFITVTNNFLEEIGIDLDFVLSQGAAGFDRSGSVPGSPAAAPTGLGEKQGPETIRIPVSHGNANEVAEALRSVLGDRTHGQPATPISVEVDGNTLVFKGPKAALDVARGMVTTMDVPGTGVRTTVVKVRDADGAAIAEIIKKLRQQAEGEKAGGPAIAVDEESNALVISGPASATAGITELIKELDVAPADTPAQLIDVQHVDASTMARQLDRLFARQAPRGRKVRIDAAGPKHILVTGPENTVSAIKEMVAKLDMKVDADAAFDQLDVKNIDGREAARQIKRLLGMQMARGQKLEISSIGNRLLISCPPEVLPRIRGLLTEIDVKPDRAASRPAEADDAPTTRPVAKALPVNPFVMTARDRLSTFAIDVDTASYAIARNHILRKGQLPPVAGVRMEEFVNAFDYNYPARAENVFHVYAEAGDSPFGRGLTLVKIGVKARVAGRDGRKPAHLVFVVDTSGSMARPDRLELVQHSLGMLVGQLAGKDRVSLVTYDTQARLLLEAHAADDRDAILEAIAGIKCQGTTNLLRGVQLGYEMAQRAFVPGQINRVILCSDGVANVGATDAESMLRSVGAYRRQGIMLTSVGFGSGSYNDELLEKLANRGDGSYMFVDSVDQARRVFVEELTANIQTVAKDAKIQVEFDPDRVRRYRLIGYENRDVADKDFRNDAIDAGEVGSGQSVTALYEVELLGPRVGGPDLGTVSVRYRDAATEKISEIAYRLRGGMVKDVTPKTAPRFFVAAAAAEFAEILRQSEHASDGSLEAVEKVLLETTAQLPMDTSVAELLRLVQGAKGLPRAQ